MRHIKLTKWRAAALAVAMIGGGLWTARTLYAFVPQPDPPGFPMITIDPMTDGARLNLMCNGEMVRGFPPGPCRVEWGFRSADGMKLNMGMLDLMPGHGMSVNLMIPPATMRTSMMFQFQPFIMPSGPGRVIPAVEIFDMPSGRTRLFINPVVPRLTFLDGGPMD